MRLWKQLTLTFIGILSIGMTAQVAHADTHTAFINQMSTPVMKVSRQYHLYGSVMMHRPR